MKASASPSKKNRRPKVHEPGTSAAKAELSGRTLLLFDIDGTLVLTGGAAARAMALAFADVFGIRDAFRGVPMAGRTDAWILADALTLHGIAADTPHVACFREVYLQRLATEIEAPGAGRKGLMPGVRGLLDTLIARDDVYLALLTGNCEAGARLKLEYFDLWRYFSGGAFGDDARQRNGLVTEAIARVAQSGGPHFSGAEVVVIGDTPLDVACAKHCGAKSLAVATGSHSVEELRAAGADVVMEDLADKDSVLRVIADFGLRTAD